MSIELVVALLVLALLGSLLLYGFAIYNSLVRGRERTMEAWSGIDVQLKRRASLVPNLVEAVRGYATHERETFEEVTRARGGLERAAGPSESSEANDLLSRALGRLFAVAERYPELQASKNFQDLQDDLYDVEEKIAFARQFFNRNAAEFNARIQSIPEVLVARLARFERFDFFEAEAEDREDVEVSFGAETAEGPTPEAPPEQAS